MQLSRFNPAAEWRTEYDRGVVTSTGTVTHTRCLNDDLVKRFKDKSNELNFSDRTEALNTETYCQTANSGLSQRRIEYALFPEFF